MHSSKRSHVRLRHGDAWKTNTSELQHMSLNASHTNGLIWVDIKALIHEQFRPYGCIENRSDLVWPDRPFQTHWLPHDTAGTNGLKE